MQPKEQPWKEEKHLSVFWAGAGPWKALAPAHLILAETKGKRNAICLTVKPSHAQRGQRNQPGSDSSSGNVLDSMAGAWLPRERKGGQPPELCTPPLTCLVAHTHKCVHTH